MGMEGMLRQVSEFELASYKRSPEKFYADLMGSYDLEFLGELDEKFREIQESPLGQKIRQRALSGLQPLPEDVAELQRQMETALSKNPGAKAQMQSHLPGPSKDGNQLCLHKSWHCLHYIFTGKSWDRAEPPLGDAIMGGTELPDRRRVMGYGPARYLSATQVRAVAGALAGFPAEAKIAAFDPETAEKQRVYVPGHEKEELLQYFSWLRDFYRDAAEKGSAVLLWVV